MKLFKMLIPLKIKWGCQISIDIAKNEKLLKLMKKSGCISVLIGFESLNPKNLKLMGKSANLINDYQEAIKKIKEYGIMIYGTFIFGYDYDTADSFKLSLEFALKNKFFLANFNPLMPMPGTRLYQRLLKEDRLIYDKWWIDEDFSYGDAMFYPKNMTVRELEDSCFNNRREFNKYSNIAARALDFKSNLRNLFVYFGGNIVSRKEIYKKQGSKLG